MERRMWIVTRPASNLMAHHTIRALANESRDEFLADWPDYYPTWKHAYRRGFRCVRCTVKTDD